MIPTATPMIPTATVGPLRGSETQTEPRSWGRRLESTENLSLTPLSHDVPAYCWPSLGLRNTAGAEILEGDVWGALKIEHAVAEP